MPGRCLAQAGVTVAGGTAFHLAAAGSYALLEAGGPVLRAVTVGTAGASGASVALHDGSSSGPVIAVVDATVARTCTFDAVMAAGLTAVVSGSPDVTITVEAL